MASSTRYLVAKLIRPICGPKGAEAIIDFRPTAQYPIGEVIVFGYDALRQQYLRSFKAPRACAQDCAVGRVRRAECNHPRRHQRRIKLREFTLPVKAIRHPRSG
ncbi:hypothetical protein, partial [uncultured Sphingobium sp.]|uniref:hypothetical protein n=1 Tax=uncultured Sphingobium sp. TaxID=316087 RepID=UPI0026395B71